MQTIKNFINDFKDFLVIRNLNRTVELNATHKSLIYSYNKEFEKEINSLVLHRLSEMMLADDISQEFTRWFRAALTQRVSFMAMKTKYPINNNQQ